MDTIVKVLNEKVADGDAKTIVEALKQIDPNAEGETVAEVLKNMELGGGGGSGLNVPHLTIHFNATGTNSVKPIELVTGMDSDYFFDNNLVVVPLANPFAPILQDPIAGGSSKDLILLYSGAIDQYWGAIFEVTTHLTLSNYINCSYFYEEGEDFASIQITDPTLNSEVTFTYDTSSAD